MILNREYFERCSDVCAEHFHVRFKALLDEKGLNVYELYLQSGIACSSLYRYCEGKSLPSIPSVITLSHVLDKPVEWLMCMDLLEDKKNDNT